MIHVKFHDDWFPHSSNIKLITSIIQEDSVLVLMTEGIYEVRLEIASCGIICISSFMKTGIDIQAIFRFCLSNLRGCNIGVTDGRFIRCTVEMAYPKSFRRLVQAFK
jgi:hypothetical protein